MGVEIKPVARYAWPAAVGAALLTRYASESLRHRREDGHGYDLNGDVDPADVSFLYAAEAITAAPISYGNDADLLINGDEIFPAFLQTIDEAERTLCLLTYVYWQGDIAREVAGAVCAAARRGVEVNVLLDAVGSLPMDTSLIDDMEDAGVRVYRFRPPKPYAVRRVTNRTHRKIMVADGRVGMIGGVGIAAEWEGNAEDPDHWRDTHVRVHGPVVRTLFGSFAENWLEATGVVLVGPGYLPELEPVDGGGAMQVVRSAAGVGDTNVEALYFLALAAAKRSVDITSAYFAPRPAFVRAMIEAAQRGLRVRVLVPGPHIDKQFVRIAGHAVYAELLEGGVEIYEYQPTMLHAKTLVLDGIWASVGSVNFDNRSFQLHDEATLCVQSEDFARKLTAQYERDLECSEAIEPDRWEARSRRNRVAERLMTLVRREL